MTPRLWMFEGGHTRTCSRVMHEFHVPISCSGLGRAAAAVQVAKVDGSKEGQDGGLAASEAKQQSVDVSRQLCTSLSCDGSP